MKCYYLLLAIFLALTVKANESYIVQIGDTLGGIALKFDTTFNALFAANPNIQNPDVIYPNQVIKLPGGARCKV